MAIIYETKEDFERDKLKDQVKDASHNATRQGSTGLAAFVVGNIVDSLNTKRTGGMRFATIALEAIGIVEIIKSFFTSSKAHDLKLKHDRMGPQVSVIPADATIPVMDDSCPICSHHKHTNNIQPTTLLEQAAKADVTLVR